MPGWRGWGWEGAGIPSSTDGRCCFLIHPAGFGEARWRAGVLREAGSVGTNGLRSGADACRTMGLLREMREEAWRCLCTASALQVGMGQLRFNEVHS